MLLFLSPISHTSHLFLALQEKRKKKHQNTKTKTTMEKTTNIIRRSIFTFLQNYNHFTSKAALLALPFSASILISQALLLNSSSSSSSLSHLSPAIHARLNTLFDAAGFPKSSEFFQVLSRKLSQTISSSIFTLPFTLSFFLASKAYVIQSLNAPKPGSPLPFSSILSLYIPLLRTYICNSLFVLSANSTAFALFLFACNALEGLGFDSESHLVFLSAAGAIVYSIVLANALVISNLALVLSGIDRKSGGYLATLKACVLIKGRTSTALSLALPMNLGLASVEALFQFRVVRAYLGHGKLGSSMVLEGVLISQLYSILLVLDTIVNVMFFRTCQEGFLVCGQEERMKEFCGVKSEIQEVENGGCCCYAKLKSLEEIA